MSTYEVVDNLNKRFSSENGVFFEPGQGGMVFANVKNEAAQARICLLGATVVEYQPHGQAPVLWLSRRALYKEGAHIRGGIPVCWPWFGVHPDPNFPSHGFVRGLVWKVSRVKNLNNRQTLLELKLRDSAKTHKFWPYKFSLSLQVVAGDELDVKLVVKNLDGRTFNFSGALHTYFYTNDVRQVEISGLEGTVYNCKVRNGQFKDIAPIHFTGETNRMYLDTDSTCTIHDPEIKRHIIVKKGGSQTTVVWNPWTERAAALPDMEVDGYLNMVCIESVVGPHEARPVNPGETSQFSTILRSEPMT